MAVTVTKYNRYQIYAAGSAAGVAQIDHGSDVSAAWRVTLHQSAMSNKSNDVSAWSQLDSEIDLANYSQMSAAGDAGYHLANVTLTQETSGTAKFDADDMIVTANGVDISAAYAVVLYASARGSADQGVPTLFIDFGQTETAGDGTTFQIQWDAAGIVQIK